MLSIFPDSAKSVTQIVGNPETRYDPSFRHIWPWPTLLLEKAADWILSLPGDTWLDAACGDGQLSKLIGCHKNLIGLDIDAFKLSLAPKHLYKGLIQTSLTEIPLSDNCLDGIVSVETLEHITDMDAALVEIFRCLQPNGYFLLTMPSVTLRGLWQMHQTKRPVYCDAREHVRELSSVEISAFPNRFKTWSNIEKLVVGRGFELVRSAGVGFLFPMFSGRLKFCENMMNLLYGERVNAFLGNLPAIRKFPYYRLILFRKK